MKKTITQTLATLLLACIVAFTSINANAQFSCGFDKVHQTAMANDKQYAANVAAGEKQIQQFIQNQQSINAGAKFANSGPYTIPVVVHIVHTGGAIGTNYNPTDVQVTGMINTLNQIYSGTYSGLSGGVGDLGLRFALAQVDPNSNATTGINRVDGSSIPNYIYSGVPGSGNTVTELAVKNLIRWDVSKYYNIWIIDKIDGVDGFSSGQITWGFAYFPSSSANLDGTMMLAAALTNTNPTAVSNGNKTLAHEMGHAFNLYHTFEGANGNFCPLGSIYGCNYEGDLVCDTDPTTQSFTTRIGTTNSCTNTTYSVNTESNFMAYTNVFTLFTAGQKARIQAALSLPSRSCYLPKSTDASLALLSTTAGSLTPSFATNTLAYTASVTNLITSITVTPTVTDVNAKVQVRVNNGTYAKVASGVVSSTLSLNVGLNPIDVTVTAEDGTTIKTYKIVVTRAMPLQPFITSFTPTSGVVGTPVTITGSGFNITPANNIVFFGATKANVTSATSTSLNVIVPLGATFAPITVLNTAENLSAYSTQFYNASFYGKYSFTTNDIAAKQDFATSTSPISSAIGDLDGDGKPDVALINFSSNMVSVLRNTGSSGTVSFASTKYFVTGNSPQSVVIRDIDGDGKPDLVVSNFSDNNVSVLRNTSSSGNISFSSPAQFATGLGSYSVAIGDIDGNGKPDLAITNYGGNTVSVLRNTSNIGTISFAAKIDFTTGLAPVSIAIGDVNGDGKPDLAIANYNSNTVSVLRNISTTGSVNFSAKSDIATGLNPCSVAFGDLDGDDKLDLAIANKSSNSVSVLKNTSSVSAISFATKLDFATGVQPYSLAIGDINGDYIPDLVVANFGSNTVSVLRNVGSNGSVNIVAKVDFATGSVPTSVAIGDLDGDGKPDITTTNNGNGTNTFSVLRNTPQSNDATLGNLTTTLASIAPAFLTGTLAYNANVTSATTSVSLTPFPHSLNATVQIRINGGAYNTVASGSPSPALSLNNGENTIEIKVTAQDGTTLTYTITVNRANPPTITSFTPTNGTVGTAVTITGTGFSSTSANNVVFFGATKATVTAATATTLTVTVPMGATYSPIAVLNTQAKLATYSSQIFNPTFSPSKGNITSVDIENKQDFGFFYPSSVVYGDIDGDGKPDMVVSGGSGGIISVLRNTGSSGVIGFATNVDFYAGGGLSIKIADVDGDGKPDIISANGDNTVSVLRNTSTSGTISFDARLTFIAGSYPLTVGVYSYPNSLAIDDIDSDGKPDLTTVNGNNTISILRNTSSIGAISFAGKVDFATGNNPSSVAIGDIDGDGKPDLAITNSGDNNVTVLRNTSVSGSFNFNYVGQITFITGTYPNSIAIGDIDGDTKLDVAITNNGSNTISILRNTSSTGSIGFDTKVDFATGNNPSSVAIGDINGDGKPDLAIGNYNANNSFGGNTVSIFRNTSNSGSIGFAQNVDFAVGLRPKSVSIVDLDGDGKPDITTANTFDNSISVLRNNPKSINANLTSLTTSAGAIAPAFAAATMAYTASVSLATSSVTVTPTVADATATMQVRVNNGSYATITSGATSSALSLNVGTNLIDVKVTAQDGTTIKTYSITIYRGTLPPPTITSISPTSGAVGATVTITGTGFSITPADNIIFFGATKATVIASTATSITVTVPSGATFAPVTVLNTFTTLATYSTQFFNPTFTPNKGSITNGDIAPKQDFAAGTNPTSAVIGDIDGDGKPDLAILYAGSNTVSILRNTSSNGTISFAPIVDFATGTRPKSVVIGDIDGDGKLDLVILNRGDLNYPSTVVSILRNTSATGSVSFATKVDFAIGGNPSSLAIGDIDGDGKPDLAITNQNNTVSIIRNTSSSGTIGFATKLDFATAGNNPQSVAIGDIDGDGKPDLAIGYLSNNVSILRNTSSSVTISFDSYIDFAGGGNSLAIGDIDGDGKLDIAASNSLLRNTSTTGTISFVNENLFYSGSLVAIGDIDGDGRPDLVNTSVVLRSNSGSGYIILGGNSGTASFATGSSPQSIAIGDIDGDGKLDLVTANYSDNTVSVLRNNPAYSTNADLYDLSSQYAITPNFTAATTAYIASVSNGSTSVYVRPRADDQNATVQVRINGGSFATVAYYSFSAALPLNIGVNTLYVKVTAQDGVTTKTYTITITRAASNNANLTSLSIAGGIIAPTFAAATTAYTTTINNTITSVTPTVADATSTVQLQINNGGYATVMSGNASPNLNLNIGVNQIDIKVTASDGSTTKTYTIMVTRGCISTSSTTVINNCGSYTWNGQTYSSSGIYNKTGLTNAAGCDSTTTLNLTIISNTISTTNISICPSELPYVWNGSRTTAGTYTFTTTNSKGCDSVATLNLTVLPNTTSTTNVSICPNALPYNWNGNRTVAGTYTFKTTNSKGCDSTATLNLSVTGSFQESFDDVSTLSIKGWESINKSSPLGSTGWYQGDSTKFTSNAGSGYIGADYDNTNNMGTISNWLITPITTIKNGDKISFYTRTTSGSQWPDRLEVRLSTNGNSNNVGNSDASVGDFTNLLLTVNPDLTTIDYPNSWTQYTVTVNSLPTPVQGRIAFRYFVTNGGASGNNSYYIGIDDYAHLSINSSTTDVSICPSQLPYSWNGSRTAAGTYTFITTTSQGCDSTATLNLTVKATSTSTTNASICSNLLPYVWNGLTFNAAGTQTAHLANAVGCDSAATLNLTVKSTSTSTTNVSICPSALPYSWNGSRTAAGTYTATLTNSQGCDSTATLNLTVKANSTSTTSVGICPSDLPYSWNGSRTAAGTYTFTTTNSKGCDSTATLNLTVKSVTSSSNTTNVCINQLPYSWNGLTFNSAGTQTAHLANSVGCDSAATLTVIVGNAVTPTVSISTTSTIICSGNDVSFTANALNGGSSPSYQWRKNGINFGSGISITFLAGTLTNNDVISCELTANNVCQTIAKVTSNAIQLTVRQSPIVNQTKAQNGATITSATICTLGSTGTTRYSNTTLNGVWNSSNPSVASVTSQGFVTGNINGTATISYTVASTNGCVAASNVLVTVAQATAPNAINGASTVCVGSSITLSSTTPGGVWTSVAGRATINAGGSLTGTSAGSAIVNYTVTNPAGCTAFASRSTPVNALPAVPSIAYGINTINPTTAGGFCTNRTINVIGIPSGGIWSKAGVINVTNLGVVTTGSTAGTGALIYTYTDANGCINSRTMSANVFACAARGISNGQLAISSDFVMYPNPAHSQLTINQSQLIVSGQIILTDLYGKTVKTQPLSMGTNTVDIAKLSKGMYFVSTITNEGKTTKKLIVE